MSYTKAQKRQVDRNLRDGFAFAREVMRNPQAYPENMVFLPFDPPLIQSVFTEERMRMWGELHRSQPRSLSEFAEGLDRDVSRVRHDLKIMERFGIVRLEKKGRRVVPTAQAIHIVVGVPTT